MKKDYWTSDEFFKKREEHTVYHDSSKDSEDFERMINEIVDKQKEFKEQEKIRDNYYKLLNDT